MYFQGFATAADGSIELISKIIEKHLKIPCYVLMGANLANEVAEEKFCETTIGDFIKIFLIKILKQFYSIFDINIPFLNHLIFTI